MSNNPVIMVNGATGFKGVIKKPLLEFTMSDVQIAIKVRKEHIEFYPNSAFIPAIQREINLLEEYSKNL